MESSPSKIQALVNELKNEMFSTYFDLYSYVSQSAYDTAWLAMIPDSQQRNRPMFSECLNWLLENQEKVGFWGTFGDVDGVPTIDSLTATLASIVALKTWDVGAKNIEKGLAYIYENSEIILKQQGRIPRWFSIILPAMVNLAQEIGLEVLFPDELKGVVLDVFLDRQRILENEELVDKYQFSPLLSYLEALPSTFCIDEEEIVMHLCQDGSLFQSPSATARAFIVTGNKKCMEYLVSLVQRCPHGAPPMYPMDEELIKLCMVNQIERLGLAEHFNEEIEEILSQVYRCYKKQDLQATNTKLVPAQLYKDSLAFRLLRTHGYKVIPWMFCWFLHHEDLMDHLEKNCENFTSVMYNVYRATDLMFSEEYEVEEARSFSKKLLEKTMVLGHLDDNLVQFPNLGRVIENELRVPWMARLNHLDHRMWIEESKFNTIWIGKASFYRLSCIHNAKLRQLAVENYEFRQSFYRKELEELKRWSKEWGLSNMGFGREKTTYCYFAVAASNISSPHNSIVRMIVSKSAIIITVADDFYDMKGSPNELLSLTEAVQRWDGEGLSGHGKIIFDALDHLVNDIGAKYLHQEGINITKRLRAIWGETFASWLTETTWSNTGYKPTKEEYLKTGMISIATHTIVVPASCFMTPSLPFHKLNTIGHYDTVTELLMASARLLNDIQSYQKELKDGKVNLVMLHLKENPNAVIEDSIAYVKEILEEKKRKLLEQVLMDEFNDLPKSCKSIHLSCLKVFQMFFNSTNLFDSETDLLQDIVKAIYVPLQHKIDYKPLKTLKPLPLLPISTSKKEMPMPYAYFDQQYFKNHGGPNFVRQRFSMNFSKVGHEKVFIPPKFNLCFT